MINLSTNAHNAKLAIHLPSNNKALSDALKNATPQQLEQLKEGRDLKSVLNALFQSKIGTTKSDTLLLDLLKNSAVFKNMDNFTDNLKSLLTSLKSNPDLAKKMKNLEHFLQPLSTADTTSLKDKITNSGIFMESKLAKLLENVDIDMNLHHDLKAQLLILKEEVNTHPELQDHIDQLTTQIDYQQLYSHLNNSTSLYFPFVWDQLEKGSLSIKNNKENKFYCEIDLTLKEYGEMNLMMALMEENQLEIQIQTQQENLMILLKEHLPELKSLLIEAGINPRIVRIYDRKDITPKKMAAYGYEESAYNSNFQEWV
jgi:flagellar hook-length control protein FliK